MAITKDDIMAQLRTVNDPELHKDLVTLNMIKKASYCDGLVDITVELTTPACPLKDKIKADVEAAVRKLGPEIKTVNIDFTAQVQVSPQQKASANNPIPQVKHIIAIGAGKGGVGKSTISVNMAVGLARTGAKVGLLDGDIYGPSAPTMLGLTGRQPMGTEDKKFVPFEVHGIEAMTIGVMVEAEKPLIWRGPMAHGAFRDLATRTDWGQLDYLIIDLPPGTGDVPLTMSQILPLSGAVVVCTPQKVAQDDARRALRMFQQLGIEVLGVIENMSYFIGDDGKEYDIFGRGGAERMAQEMGVPFLGMVPINMALRENSDLGDPTANFKPGTKLAEELDKVVRRLAGQVSLKSRGPQGPNLNIS